MPNLFLSIHLPSFLPSLSICTPFIPSSPSLLLLPSLSSYFIFPTHFSSENLLYLSTFLPLFVPIYPPSLPSLSRIDLTRYSGLPAPPPGVLMPSLDTTAVIRMARSQSYNEVSKNTSKKENALFLFRFSGVVDTPYFLNSGCICYQDC